MHNAAIAYKGYILKSKTEFQWARYFETEGLDWEYESVTFRAGRNTYTPDFSLGQRAVPIEIKVWGATNLKNNFYLCPFFLLIIFGLPDRHYVRVKQPGASQLDRGHYRHWSLAYQRVAA